jgi:hypothetical protein
VRLGRPIVAALARVERGGLSATARLNCASTQGHKIRIAVSVCPVRVPRRRRVGPSAGRSHRTADTSPDPRPDLSSSPPGPGTGRRPLYW